MSSFLETLKERIIVFDGAMGTNLQVQNLTLDDFGGPRFEGCNENLLVTRPDAVEKVHAGFLDVGCDVVETNSFNGTPVDFAEYDIADKAYEMNVLAARLAKRVASDYSTKEKPRWVAGSMGPGRKLPTLGHISYAELRDSYGVQARGLLDGGADLLIIETCQDLLQTKAALAAIFALFEERRSRVPVFAQVTIEVFGTMLNGTEIAAALTALAPFPIDVVGMNCGTGPKHMTESIRYICDNSPLPVSVLPNAGLPSVVEGKMHYDETPESFTAQLVHFASDFGVNVVGGCCGTTPAHLRLAVEAMQRITPKLRNAKTLPAASSIYFQQPYVQDASFLIVGERVNASGSKKMRDLLDAADWDGLVALGKEQEREGAHILDVNVDFVGRDGEADMHELASRLVTNVKIPLMFDSTEWQKMEAGLQHAGGKCILNSTNYEDGVPRFLKVIDLAKRYGASVVVGTIDEEGMARSSEGKVKIAKRAYEQATTEAGLPASDIFFDPLALPISTGIEEDRRNALQTIEAIKRIKAELPGAFTILGVSNISFGLNPASRVVLNSVFLHDAVEAGLDAAIVNASKIEPLNRIGEQELKVARELIYDQRKFEGDVCVYDPLTEFTKLFEGVKSKSAKKTSKGETVEERLKNHIIDGEKIGLEDELRLGLEKYSALDIINNILLEGMKVVGDLFGSGQMQLPFVLQSAEAMKAAVRFLEPFMEKKGGATAKGTMVLATVKGDVHDIGKNLVDIILTNNGYEVHNLGIKVSISEMIAKFEETSADAIGMSGLLVKSTLIMRDNLDELERRGLGKVPILLGGAALTRSYVEADLRARYQGPLYYGKNAFAGLDAMGRIVAGEPAPRPIAPRQRVEETVDAGAIPARSPEVKTDNQLFTPPFTGSRVIRGVAIDEIVPYLNLTALFRNQWQYRPEKGERDPEFKQRMAPLLREQVAKARAEDLLHPKVVYGYFPANSDGDDLVIWDDERAVSEMTRFSFPRQQDDPYLCIADFFRPVGEEVDHAAFHIVTMGSRISEKTKELFDENRYTDYLLLHGLGVELAEALAEHWHHRIREEWGFASEDGPSLLGLFRQQYRGGRYSWGYPACPDLEDNEKVAYLLGADRIGITVGQETSYQYQPEQTTSAVICHHPQAKYFVARKPREKQDVD